MPWHIMEALLHESLLPVLLGSNTLCHACVRHFEKQYGVGCVVLTGKRALTLRFLPKVTMLNAPATFSDSILLSILTDVEDEGGYRIPLLVLCDPAYQGFVDRNREALETRFILRRAENILGLETVKNEY